MVERINKLIRETHRNPFAGVGKPEALKHALSGCWSRRITDEHRMVYRVERDALLIAQVRCSASLRKRRKGLGCVPMTTLKHLKAARLNQLGCSRNFASTGDAVSACSKPSVR